MQSQIALQSNVIYHLIVLDPSRSEHIQQRMLLGHWNSQQQTTNEIIGNYENQKIEIKQVGKPKWNYIYRQPKAMHSRAGENKFELLSAKNVFALWLNKRTFEKTFIYTWKIINIRKTQNKDLLIMQVYLKLSPAFISLSSIWLIFVISAAMRW